MDGSKLYVGNISYSAGSEQLKGLFSSYGEVKEVTVIQGKGFGFVEMSNPEEAAKAKEALNGSQWEGRTIRVDEAKPQRTERRSGGYQQGNRGAGGRSDWGRGGGGSGRDRGYRRQSY